MFEILKSFNLLVLMLCFSSLTVHASKTSVKKGILIDRIIALVGKKVILYSELEEGMMAMARNPKLAQKSQSEMQQEVIKTLIADRLIEIEIASLKLSVSESEVERAFEATKVQYNLDDTAFAMALAQQGMTLERYKKTLKKQLLKMKLVDMKVKSQVHISDQDVDNMSLNSKAKANANYRIKARHIVFLVGEKREEIAQKEQAKLALKRLNKGDDFSTVALEMSEGPSKNSGGVIGVFGRGEMLTEFENAAYKAQIGVVFGPVRTEMGYHIIEVLEHVKDTVISSGSRNDEELQKLKSQLYEEEMSKAFEGYILSLRAKQYIEIRDLSDLN